MAAAEEPLLRLDGNLHAVTNTADVGLGSLVGSFELESAGSQDLRLTPGSLSLSTSLGSIAGEAAPATPYDVRRIDPATGRPLDAGETTGCVTGFEDACLPIASNFSIGPDDPNALDPARNDGSFAADPPLLGADHTYDTSLLAANALAFDAICATSVGRMPLNRAACAQTFFSNNFNPSTGMVFDPSTRHQPGSYRISELLSNILAGNATAARTVTSQFARTTVPLVPLNEDPCDDLLSGNQGACTDIQARMSILNGVTLNEVLTDEQEALLGCGPFWGTDCEVDGIDLLNAEASVVMQSFVGFDGGPVGLRNANVQMIQVVGSRGPEDSGHNPLVDGTVAFAGGAKSTQCAGVTRLSIPCFRFPLGPNPFPPFTGGGYGLAAGQPFASEMAALSFNFQNLLVAFSTAPAEELDKAPPPIGSGSGGPDYQLQIAPDELNPQAPFSNAPNQCSFLQPQHCREVERIVRWSSNLPPDDPSGPSSIRWSWENGASFAITNATGELASFAGGVAHLIGPEVERFGAGTLGITVILEPPPGVTPASNVLVKQFGVGLDGIPDTEDDEGRPLGFAYGVAPEASELGSGLAALAALALISSPRAVRRRALRSRVMR
jgi:hypothetical protein